MPDPGELVYIINWLFEAGPVKYSSMGASPLDWVEIKAWSDIVGIELQPNEATALRQLSATYLSQKQKAEDKACPPPWTDPDQIDRDKVADKVSSTFKAIANRRKKTSG